MSTFLKSVFLENEEELEEGVTTFYGVRTDIKVSIDSEITIPAPINDLHGRHMKFNRFSR